MLSATITDRDVAVGVRAVVLAARLLLGRLSDPDFVPPEPDDDPPPDDDAADEPAARGLRGIARRGGQRARQGVTAGLERWAADRPGSPGWGALDRDRRADWWMGTVGRVTAAVAALPGLAGPVAERVPVKDLVSAAGQALLLCAVAHEYGLRDTDDYVVLLAMVILDRDVAAALGTGAAQPAEQEAAQLTSEIRGSGTMSRHLATGASLVRIGRRLHALQEELEHRPRGHVGQRLAGSLPVVGLVGQYRGERRGLRIASDRGRQWCADRVARQPALPSPAPPVPELPVSVPVQASWSHPPAVAAPVPVAASVPVAAPALVGARAPRGGGAYAEMRSAMDLVEAITREHYPASILDASDDERSPSWTFGIGSPGGIALVWADVRDVDPGGSWFLQFTAGIAHSVPDVGAAMQWVNERNRLTTVGRFYCGVAHHGQSCSILWEDSLWSRLLTQPGPPDGAADGVLDWITQLVHMAYETPTDHRTVLEDLGGRPYPAGREGIALVRATA